jgi:hypothetical protein
MAIAIAGDFTISFAREGYEPQTVTVHSTMSEGDYMTAPSPGGAANQNGDVELVIAPTDSVLLLVECR